MRPHITICYSTSSQPAKPIVDVLGTRLPGCDIDISALSLVIQHGPERAWDGSIVSTIRLAATGANLARRSAPLGALHGREVTRRKVAAGRDTAASPPLMPTH